MKGSYVWLLFLVGACGSFGAGSSLPKEAKEAVLAQQRKSGNCDSTCTIESAMKATRVDSTPPVPLTELFLDASGRGGPPFVTGYEEVWCVVVASHGESMNFMVGRKGLFWESSRLRKGQSLLQKSFLVAGCSNGVKDDDSTASAKDEASARDAYIETMKSDLRNLVVAQEAFYTRDSTYATSVEALGDYYRFGREDRVQIVKATGIAWSAEAKHEKAPGVVCTISVGATDAANEGVPTCKQVP